MAIKELAQRFVELKAASEELGDKLKEVNAAWTEVETQLLEAMVEEGVNSVKLAGLGHFIMSTKNYLSVNAANKPGFYAYLKESGNGALLKEEVNPRTLTAFLKGHLEEVAKRIADDYNLDNVEARNKALEFLNQKGASYFSERGITLRAEK